MKTWQRCFKNTIKECDWFGTFISFRINDDWEYKSWVGGFSTILFIIAALCYTVFMSFKFLSRSNVNFIFSNKILDKGPFINWTDCNFNLAFGVQYHDDAMPAILDTEKYFNYSMNIVEWIGEENISLAEFDFKSCDNSDFYNWVDESFETNGWDQMICPVLNEKVNFTIDGWYTDYYFKFITLEVKLTEYALNNMDEVRTFMKENPIEMAVFFLDSAIDYESRAMSIPTYINYSYKLIDFDFIKTTDIFISSLEFKNDDNLVFDSPITTIDAMYDHSLDSFRYIPDRISHESGEDNEAWIGKFIIKASPKIIQVNREYLKFPSFLADLTSILEEILIWLLLMVNYFERKAVDHKLIEKMLKFKGSKYFDLNYWIKTFNRDKISNGIMDVIEKQKWNIERKNNVVSNKSVMILLKNNKNPEDIEEDRSINSSDGDKQEITSKQELFSAIPSRPKRLNQNAEIKNDIEINTKDNLFPMEEKRTDTPKKSSLETLNSKLQNEDNILNKNINIFSNSLSSKNNSVYFKNEIDVQETNNQNYRRYNSQLSSLSNKDNILTLEEVSSIKYQNWSICEILWTNCCFWVTRRQRTKYKIIRKAENKIHYYLDIYTYIQKMQEIDIIKYSLYDEDQMNWMKFLSKPPIKMSGGTSGIYREFAEQQKNLKRFGKEEIDKLLQSYYTLRDKEEITFEDLKLLRLVKAEIDFLSD